MCILIGRPPFLPGSSTDLSFVGSREPRTISTPSSLQPHTHTHTIPVNSHTFCGPQPQTWIRKPVIPSISESSLLLALEHGAPITAVIYQHPTSQVTDRPPASFEVNEKTCWKVRGVCADAFRDHGTSVVGVCRWRQSNTWKHHNVRWISIIVIPFLPRPTHSSTTTAGHWKNIW